jgi:inosine-uridine nucleoside N-ribohydrolase
MLNFPALATSELIQKLEPPKGKVSMILDTDTYNEVDDQFAIAHALFSPEEVDLLAVYAAPFHNERSDGPGDGMERSHREIENIFALAGHSSKGKAFRGSRSWLPGPSTPVESPAAVDFVEKACTRDPADPLYAVMIGAPTNIASALLMEPGIINRVVLVFIGGQPFHYPPGRDFNLDQDPCASQVLFNCGAPLVHIPSMGVASNLTTSIPEIDFHLKGRNGLCNYLAEIVRGYKPATIPGVWSKVIWDIAATAWPIIPRALKSHLRPSPILTDNLTWSFDPGRHLIRQVDWIERDIVFNDVFRKLHSA